MDKVYSNTDHNYYWFNGGDSVFGGGLPPQAIPLSKKNTAWKKAVMDSLERTGIHQIRENLKFKDFYRMIEGKMAYAEIEEVLPQLSEVVSELSDHNLPKEIKHYDITGLFINTLAGELPENSDTFSISTDDEISENEYVRTKTDLLQRFVREEFERELHLRLLAEGINPDIDGLDMEDPEAVEQYKQMIQQKRLEKTPVEIEQYMNKTWKVSAVEWAENTLEQDEIRFHLDELDKNEFIDLMASGRCFRHYRVGYDYYKPETWSVFNTFFSQDVETKYVQDGEYVGRVHFYTPSQVVNRYGHLLSNNQIEVLLGTHKYNDSVNRAGYGSRGSWVENNNRNLMSFYSGVERVPHEQYYDYEFIHNIQEATGIPMGETTSFDANGNPVTKTAFLPSRNKETGYSSHIAKAIKDDLKLRSDLVQVTEAYWVSYKKIGLLTYQSETGRVTQEIVTEDILPEFLKEHGILNVRSRSLVEAEQEPEINTIVWSYIPEVWQGVKINAQNTRFEESLYLGVEPMPFQIKGDSNVYDVKLPVAGIVDVSQAMKIFPYQVGHNIALNQAYELMAKEIGAFFLFDINFLPSEFKAWDSTAGTLTHLRNLVKDVGLFPVDTGRQNLRDGGGFNQFTVQNLSFAEVVMQKFQIAENYKMKAMEQMGITPGRMGQPIKYETAEGVRQSQSASYAQTETLFDKFNRHKKRALDIHLSVAQYAQKEGKDITVYYTKSDSERAFLKFSDPYFQLRKLSVIPTMSAKARKTLLEIRSYLMNTNTMGSDEYAIAKLFTSDTLVGLIEAARKERFRREEQLEAQREHEMASIERKAQLENEAEEAKWQRAEYSKEKDRQNKIDVEYVEALGKAVDNNTDKQDLQYIANARNEALTREKLQADIKLRSDQLEADTKANNDKLKLEYAKLDLKLKQIEAQREGNRSRVQVAGMNKN